MAAAGQDSEKNDLRPLFVSGSPFRSLLIAPKSHVDCSPSLHCTKLLLTWPRPGLQIFQDLGSSELLCCMCKSVTIKAGGAPGKEDFEGSRCSSEALCSATAGGKMFLWWRLLLFCHTR